MTQVWGIVLAAGSGARFGGGKQFADLDGRTLLEASAQAAATVADGLVMVLPMQVKHWQPQQPEQLGCPLVVVGGGEQRADSVRAGLAAVPAEATVIVVADAAHPLAGRELYAGVVRAVVDGADAAVPGLPLTEVVAQVDAAGMRVGGVPREGHVLVQMPQAFRAQVLRRAHRERASGVDDSTMVAQAGGRVRVIPGAADNIHVTNPQELQIARLLAAH